MGLFNRAEQRLERAVNGVFARVFKSEVQPVEIASAIRRAMDQRAAVLGRGRTIVPNLFAVELSASDYEHLTAYVDELTDELVASALEHADTQRYTPGGPVNVSFTSSTELETGVFQLRTSTAKAAASPSQQLKPQHAPSVPPQDRMPQDRMPQQAPFQEPVRMPQPQQGAPAPQSWDSGHGAPAPQLPGPGAGQTDATSHFPAEAPTPPPRRPANRPWLDIDGQRYPLLGAITVLGRDDSADVVLDDPGISRRHSEIRVTSDGPHLLSSLRDLHSTNGTYVNGDPVTSRRLADGDRITVGRTALTFRTGERR